MGRKWVAAVPVPGDGAAEERDVLFVRLARTRLWKVELLGVGLKNFGAIHGRTIDLHRASGFLRLYSKRTTIRLLRLNL